MDILHEIEIQSDTFQPTYVYVLADEDIDISPGKDKGYVTHITTLDTDLGITPDLIIRRRID